MVIGFMVLYKALIEHYLPRILWTSLFIYTSPTLLWSWFLLPLMS